MRLEELKRGFWGYKRDSVYQYIAQIEEEFSTKLLEKDEQLKKAVEDARQEAAQAAEQVKKDAEDLAEQAKLKSAHEVEQARLQAEKVEKASEQLREELERTLRRVSELETALSAIQTENATLHQEAYKISAAILDAQRYAQQLRDETENQERRAREDLQAQVDRQRQELAKYADKVGVLKRSLGALLLEMDRKTDVLEEQRAELEAHAPVVKLVTFPSASGTPFPTRINLRDSQHADSD